ncbi:MAG: D-glycero-beta-D-manno-heptose 1-phosphate adenylyltransferase [Chitinispirillaceae bacterium]|jgi:rfaE bifunctional protein nucleotidyltransferase chain/domain|nr:D-glycero-beta-D-manno-heptose 1-phosphate adenylyltransferase [Chitinispirillaceae bacterium]
MRTGTLPDQKVFAGAAAVSAHFAPLRAQGKTLVTTNGCFDILHAGHVRYLTEAAALGDFLVVGLNADATVRKLKGESRPVNSEAARASVMAALCMVDGVFIFHEDDPRAFLGVLRPDLHVKGGDYTQDIIEREAVERGGGRVAIVSFVEGFSTTSIIKKIAENGST